MSELKTQNPAQPLSCTSELRVILTRYIQTAFVS